MRERLSRLSEARLAHQREPGLETVLQGVLDSARVLTEARYGFIIMDDSGQNQELLTSGMSAEGLAHVPGGPLDTEMFSY